MDYGADQLYTEMAEAALSGWDGWNAAWPSKVYHQDGFLLLTAEPMAPGGFEHESYRVLERRGHAPERLDAAAIQKRFPAWRSGKYCDGYLSVRAGWAESGKAVAHLAAIARESGVRLIENAAFRGFVEEQGSVRGVRTEVGDLRADH